MIQYVKVVTNFFLWILSKIEIHPGRPGVAGNFNSSQGVFSFESYLVKVYSSRIN